VKLVAATPPNVTFVVLVRLTPVIGTTVSTEPLVSFKADLRGHPEGHVALERSLGRRHPDRASGRTSWHRGRDQGRRNHLEDCRRAVKRDAGRAGQTGSQNFDGRTHLAGGGLCFHKRAKPYRQAEDRAVAAGPAERRCPVELPIGALDQRRFGAYAVRAIEAV